VTSHDRLLIVLRYRTGWQHAHIAAAMSVCRKCVKTWFDRYAAEGEAGQQDSFVAAAHDDARTPADVEQRVLLARRQHRHG
jgi:Homeodomain-like domain